MSEAISGKGNQTEAVRQRQSTTEAVNDGGNQWWGQSTTEAINFTDNE